MMYRPETIKQDDKNRIPILNTTCSIRYSWLKLNKCEKNQTIHCQKMHTPILIHTIENTNQWCIFFKIYSDSPINVKPHTINATPTGTNRIVSSTNSVLAFIDKQQTLFIRFNGSDYKFYFLFTNGYIFAFFLRIMCFLCVFGIGISKAICMLYNNLYLLVHCIRTCLQKKFYAYYINIIVGVSVGYYERSIGVAWFWYRVGH